MAAALGQNLVLNVEGSDIGTSVLVNGLCDGDGA